MLGRFDVAGFEAEPLSEINLGGVLTGRLNNKLINIKETLIK